MQRRKKWNKERDGVSRFHQVMLAEDFLYYDTVGIRKDYLQTIDICSIKLNYLIQVLILKQYRDRPYVIITREK